MLGHSACGPVPRQPHLRRTTVDDEYVHPQTHAQNRERLWHTHKLGGGIKSPQNASMGMAVATKTTKLSSKNVSTAVGTKLPGFVGMSTADTQ